MRGNALGLRVDVDAPPGGAGGYRWRGRALSKGSAVSLSAALSPGSR